MAKYDSQFSRTAAIEEDEKMEQFYRSAPSPRTRAYRQPADPARSEARSEGRPRSRNSEDEDEDNQGDTFLRARRRVPVRRGMLPNSRNGRIAFGVGALLGLAALIALVLSVVTFLRSDSRLRIDSASNIQIMGNSQVTRSQLLSVFGSDIGRNIFFVPLKERTAELEQLPWVDRASVMRLLPNQLRVSIVERVPVAFLRNGNSVGLVDADGIVLNLPPAMMAARRFSFPVVKGIAADDPLPLRAARIKLYQKFVTELDSGGDHVSSKLSEVDISDPEDIRAFLPAQGSDILVHFGEGNFLNRYRRYQQHLDEWRKQYPHLASVDLRYDNQVVLGMAGSEEASAQQSAKIMDDASTAGDAGASASVVAPPPAHKPAGKKPTARRPHAVVAGHNPAKHAAGKKKKPTKQNHKAKSTGHTHHARSQG